MHSLAPDDPRTLGSYRLLGRLGAGGMGRVYLARSGRGRTVAVKLVHPELANQESFRQRFRQEVAAARRVGGEWTAPVLDADTEAAIPWVATGYIAGPTLQRVARDFGPLPERSVRALGAGLARALQAIHAAGIVHRDLKPSNVLITLDGPRVIDFGIARALDSATLDGGVTRTGAAVGSPGFMSPEQVRGERVTAASDVFCLGSVLAYAASGRMPFGGESSGAHALMFRIAEEEPDLSTVPDALRPLISACLAKNPADRPGPEDVVRQTGALDLLTDPRAAESWLPGGLVTQLGRQAIRLLDAEDPDGDGYGFPHPPTTATPPPAATPTVADHSAYGHPTPSAGYAHPTPGGAYGHPAPGTAHAHPAPGTPGRPRRGRTPLLIAALLLAGLAGAGAVAAYYVMHQDDTSSLRADEGEDEDENGGKNGGGNGDKAPGPTPSGPGAVPQRFLGTWDSNFNNTRGLQIRRIIISQGKTGAPVAKITGAGTNDKDGVPYRCAWTATLAAAGTDTSALRLNPSKVTVAEPPSKCQPGRATELTLLSDTTLTRDFLGSDQESLTYTRVE